MNRAKPLPSFSEAPLMWEPVEREDLVSRPAGPMGFSWKWSLATVLLFLLVTMFACVRYYETSRKVPAELLARANSAEQQGDWPRVISFLSRYLEINGDDYEISRRLADLYFERLTTYEDYQLAIQYYEPYLASVETEDSFSTTKLRFISLLAFVNSAAALETLSDWLPTREDLVEACQSESLLIDALIIRAELLEQQLIGLSQSDLDSAREQLMQEYDLLSQVDADQTAYRQRLAVLYRQHADSIWDRNAPLAKEYATNGDKLMNQLVKENPGDVDVLLGRFKYQLQYSKSGNPDTSDLEKVLELNPDDPRALMSLAMLLAERNAVSAIHSRTALMAARDFLQRSVDDMPERADVLVALASIHLQLQEIADAETVLQRAKAEFPGNYIVLTSSIKLAISEKQFEEASKGITELRRLIHKRRIDAWSKPSELNDALVNDLIADVLEAGLILRSNKGEAAESKAVELLRGLDYSRLQRQQRVDVLEDVGRLFALVEQWEEAIDILTRARDSGIVSLGSEFLLAQSYERVDKVESAIALYREIGDQPLPSVREKELWYRLGKLQLKYAQNLGRLTRWADVELAVAKLDSLAPASIEAFLLATSLRLARGISDSEKMIAELQEADVRFGGNAEYWELCNQVHLELGELQLAQNSIAKLKELKATGDGQRASNSQQTVVTNRLSVADKEYAERLSQSTGQRSLEFRLELIREWCRDVPDSIASFLALADLGAESHRADLIDEAVEALRSIEVGDGYFWRLAEVSQRLVGAQNGNLQAGVEAQRLAEALSAEFPDQVLVAKVAANCQKPLGMSNRHQIIFYEPSSLATRSGRFPAACEHWFINVTRNARPR